MTIPTNESVKAKRTSDLKGMMTTYACKSVEENKNRTLDLNVNMMNHTNELVERTWTLELKVRMTIFLVS